MKRERETGLRVREKRVEDRMIETPRSEGMATHLRVRRRLVRLDI